MLSGLVCGYFGPCRELLDAAFFFFLFLCRVVTIKKGRHEDFAMFDQH